MGGDKRGWEIQSGIDEQLSNSTLLSVRVLSYFITRPRNYYFSNRGSWGLDYLIACSCLGLPSLMACVVRLWLCWLISSLTRLFRTSASLLPLLISDTRLCYHKRDISYIGAPRRSLGPSTIFRKSLLKKQGKVVRAKGRHMR